MSATPEPTEQERVAHYAVAAKDAGIMCHCDMKWRDVPTYDRHLRAAVARDRARDDDLAARVEALADELHETAQAMTNRTEVSLARRSAFLSAAGAVRALLAD